MRSSILLFAAAPLWVACTNGKTTDTGTPVTLAGPTLASTPPGAVAEGGPLEIDLTASDPDGLGAVSIYHRSGGDPTWTLLPMTPGTADAFSVTLTDTDVRYPSVDYYFKATDAGTIPASSYLPESDPANLPFSIPVTVQGVPFPYFEDFESDDGSVADLSTLGWASSTTGERGYEWQSSGAQAYSGTTCAFHPLGYTGAPTSKDYLVSPAIDLTSATTAQVTWQELGNFVGTANHGLYISTTSRDPASGAFTLVSALAAPTEDAWARSQVVDLSAYVGSTVYLAWYWEGTGADDWYVDDVNVQPLQADLSETWAILPDSVHPGDSTALTVTVTNAASVGAEDAVVTLAFPSGGASADLASVDVGPVPASGSATATFNVTVDPTEPDNRYVPMEIGLTSGDSTTTEATKLLVGTASTVTLTWSADADGYLQADVGVGDTSAPGWTATLYAANVTAGAVSASMDITDEGDLLPPGPGDMRWWTDISTAGGGHVSDLVISYGGQDYAATSLPVILAGGTDTCWVPDPPAFTVTANTSPTTVAPGDSVTLNLSVTDTGAATAGAVVASLSSSDPDVTVTNGDARSLTSGVMASGQRASVSGFAFDVASTHADSTDVSLDVTLDDGVESWLVPVNVAVPFPVLVVSSIVVNDVTGNNDGILDPGESATLTVNMTNVGDESASGAVTGVMTVDDASVATADVPASSELFGTLPKGSTADARFDVTVTGGSSGDPLDLNFALADSSHSYTSGTEMVLGEPTWNLISSKPDAENDALSGWDFDIVDGYYRVVDGVMQIRLTSSTVYDPTKLFVEFWGSSAGADYYLYWLVAQSGVGTLRGYDGTSGTFTELPAPTISSPDAYTVELDFAVADLGLFNNKLTVGFGSGWCGAPNYYCDSFPDNWGYPYDSYDPTNWYTLSW